MTRQATRADYGLVGAFVGGVATLLLGMVTIGMSAFLGRIPVILGALLGLAGLTLLVSLGVLAVASRNPGDRPPETG